MGAGRGMGEAIANFTFRHELAVDGGYLSR
jgi:hypothetical protein